jgi:ribonuclease E
MTKRMLIDATHAEETRVVVLDGSRLEDFDVETSTKRQLKGNIYLAKVVRVEPSLQAAFVEYGGNRHGFLAFGEIHPDYYQIPVADRQRLLAMEAEDARREEEEEDRAALQSDAAASAHAMTHAEVSADADEALDEPGTQAEPEAQAEPEMHAGPETQAEPGMHAEPWSSPWSSAEPETTDAAGPDDMDTVESAWAASVGASVRAQPARIEIESVGGALGASETGGDAPETLVDAAVLRVPAASALAEIVEPAPEPESIETGAASDSDPGETATERVAQTGAEAAAGLRDVEHDAEFEAQHDAAPAAEHDAAPAAEHDAAPAAEHDAGRGAAHDAGHDAEPDGEPDDEEAPDILPPETVGGDVENGEDARERRIPPRFLRNYKIQEVIRRRQILLVQVVKEERGTKGAALTSYISLAGRYCVLMPNSPRGGGISRKITSATDRRRLKEVTAELDIPDGMGLIVRTAGGNRPKPEIKRDCEYLMRLWDDIRELTMKSVAPALIYEEASLIKRSIRDVYSRDIDEILVDGEDGWKAARDFMRMLMPTHVKKVQLWREPTPLFARQQVEAQLDGMVSPTVQLRSGGYLVINQTEALVAIDVNSGRSTRERGIEETALRTNVEAVDEVARQLRLRDLAGLIVIDLIDMESRKNNTTVERRLKEALKVDRARIQVGHISHFGLMEMSRQRLRPSLAETSFVTCPHCGGAGHVRGTESAAIHVLRDIEEEGSKRRAAEILVRVASPIAMYILNHKRMRLGEIEARYAMHVTFVGDDSLIPPQIRVERVRAAIEAPVAVTQDARPEPEPPEESAAGVADDLQDDDDAEAEGAPEGLPAGLPEGEPTGANAEGASPEGANAEIGAAEEAERRRRRRRRRRGGRREEGAPVAGEPASGEPASGNAPPTAPPTGPRTRPPAPPIGPQAEFTSDAASLHEADLEQHIEGVPEHADAEAGAGDDAARARRRGRRGGRRRRRDGPDGGQEQVAEPGAEQPELAPIYTGPTPADPFGGHAFDIFDVLEQAEQAADRQIPLAPEPQSEFAPQPQFEPAPEPRSSRVPESPSDRAFESQAYRAPASRSEPAPHRIAELAPEPAPEPATEPVSEPPTAPLQAAAPPLAADPVAAEPEPTIVAEPEPVPDAPVASEPLTGAPSPPVPANDAVPEPLVKPIVIGGQEDAPAGEKKRGWWRR